MVEFAVSLVARVPQPAGPPVLVEVNRLVVDNISYTEELNRPGTATLGCPIRSITDDVRTRLGDLRSFPSEAWIYTDSTVAWAGEVLTPSVRDQSLQLSCVGLLGYTHRWGVTADLTYANTDQFTIAKGLVDHWQGLPYGHFGINTAAVGTSGVLRDRTYLRDELHPIGQRLAELGAVDNGFDLHVDPASRALVLSYPRRGVDLTASVFLDKLNIDSAAIAMSVAPDDLVSDVSATGTSQSAAGTGATIYTARSNAALRASYGRTWGSATFDGVTVQSTLDGHADEFLAARGQQFFQPGVTLFPRPGVEAGAIRAGDTVSYAYDAGLGLQAGAFRIAKVTVDVDNSGKQRLSVEFT